jgi:hypothetical protein
MVSNREFAEAENASPALFVQVGRIKINNVLLCFIAE